MPVRDGECIEISTGAPMPDGADAVVMVEETDTERRRCRRDLRRSAAAAERRRARRRYSGRPGRRRGRRNAQLEPHRRARRHRHCRLVRSIDRPRVAILSTGNEVVEPGAELKPGQIYDINRFTLSAVVSENGGIPVADPPAPDTLDALSRTLDDLVACDIVVFSGGSSVGERDLIRDAIAARGTLLFHGVAVKPGKPTGLGIVKASRCLPCPAIPRRACRTRTCCSCRCCDASRGWARDQTRCDAAAGAAHRVGRGPASVLYGSDREWRQRCLRSRRRATSPACRGRTDISRFPRMSTPSKREPRST